MCRMIAYVGPPVVASRLLVDPPHSLLDQCVEARLQTSGRDNPDGWGIGWYVAPGVPQRYRTVTPMPVDGAGLARLTTTTSGHLISHVRLKSPGSPLEEAGNAPFVDGPWLFAHNGHVEGFREGRREELRAQLSAGRRAALQSEADSEVLFGLVLDRLDAGASPLDAVRGLVESLGEGNYNLFLTDGSTLVALRWGNSLWFRRDDPEPGGVVIASEPHDDREWTEVPDRTFLVHDADGLAVVPARSAIRVDVHMGPTDLDDALRADVARGLTSSPKELPPKWFYDDRGCDLFDQITRLPEYYPTECERAILRAEATAIVDLSGADTLVELGSGTSDKTRTLLDAMSGAGRLRRFVPFEISETTLRTAASAIADEYPGVEIHAVCGDFERHLGELPPGGRRLVAFLGGTIGNFGPAERKRFLADLADGLEPGDHFLLGTDLVKDAGRLEAAYDDAQGVTAEFNLNVLQVVNRELGANFDPSAFAHVARFDLDEEWIEMRLRSLTDQRVSIADLDLTVHFAEGEEMRTEISAKFRRERVEVELAAAGLELVRWMTDPAGDFAVSLSRRR
jgi:dimethylhistidine N-methyltransferase